MVIVSVDTPKKNSLVFTIEDEGFGFTPEDVPDPTSPENIEKPHGRGIFLMKHQGNYSDTDLFAYCSNIFDWKLL